MSSKSSRGSTTSARRGIRNWQATPTIKDVAIDVQGGSIAYGIVNSGAGVDTASGTRANVERTTISVSNATNAYGILQKAYSVLDARDVRITVTGGSTTYGFGVDPNFYSNISATFHDAKILVQGAASWSYGIQFRGSQLKVEHSRIEASATGQSYGVDCQTPIDPGLIDHSEIAGATFSVSGVNVGASQLRGGAAAFSICAGIYDESYVFSASTCP